MAGILSDPRNFGQLLYVMEPLLDRKDLYFPTRRNVYAQMMQDADVDDESKEYLEALRSCNEDISQNLHLLRNKIVIYVNGVTICRKAGQERYMCSPPFDGDGLAYAIKRVVAELDRRVAGFPVESFAFVPVSPVVTPYIISKEHEIDPLFASSDYSFSDTMFDAAHAKRALARSQQDAFADRELERYTSLNTYIMANAFARVIERTRHEGPPPFSDVHLFAKRTSYTHKVMKLACKVSSTRLNDFGKVMRNTDMSMDGECDPAALDVLRGFVSSVGEKMSTRIQ